MAKKQNRITELYEWLDNNKIQYEKVDNEVIFIPEFGKAYFQDTQKSGYHSIFRKDRDGETVFNSVEEPDVLMAEDINYIVFKFGDGFYYHDMRGAFKLNILKYVGQRQPSSRKEKFVNLGVHTPFELLNGSFMPQKWVEKAKYLGLDALGICDHNTMAACFQFYKACKEANIKHIFGYSLTVNDEGEKFGAKVYVQTNKGYRNLLRIQKAIMVDNVENKTISLDELLTRGEGNVLVMDKYTPSYMDEHRDVLQKLTEAFDDIFYQVDLSEYKAERIDIRVLEATKYYFDKCYEDSQFPAPILISDCYYLDKDDAKNKIILNKVAEGAAHEQSDDQYFKDIDEHFQFFAQTFGDNWDVDDLFAECCENTVKVANGAVAEYNLTRNYMPKYDMTDEEKQKYGTVHNMFTQLLEEGLEKLTPPGQEERYRKQMEYEKYIIESTDNVDYLLVQYDTCNWARRNNILVGCGRGSAAGSLLLYLLGVTLIDPIKYDLIFERFLLPERAGLFPTDTTIIGEDIDSTDYMEVKLESGVILKIDKDAQLIVKRDGEEEPIVIYADELEDNDDILFDNKDEIFTINEL